MIQPRRDLVCGNLRPAGDLSQRLAIDKSLPELDLQQTTKILAPDLRTDPDLAAVVEAWGDLPAAVRAGVVAMVRAAR